MTLKTTLIAIAAIAALLGAAAIAVPLAHDGLHVCRDLPWCLGF